jgi:AcrR family transcriptional regulator
MARPDKNLDLADTPTRILTAAERIIRRKGVRQLSFERIAEAAGLTRGAIYYNFKGRHDLYLSLLEFLMDRRIDGLTAQLESTAVARRVVVLGEALALDIVEWRSWTPLFLEIWLDAIDSAPLMERLTALRAQFYAQIGGVLRQAFPSVDPQAADDFAVILMGMSAGLSVETSISGRMLNLEDLEHFLVNALETHFGDASERPLSKSVRKASPSAT